MKIFEYNNGEIREQRLLIDALKIEINKKNIISFVGGGGKTSSIYKLGEELKELGKKVIITTTTRMFMPESNTVITGKKEDIIKLLNDKNMITVGLLCDEKNEKFDYNKLKDGSSLESCEEHIPRKISGVSKEIAESFIEIADFVLVEADGAKGLSLKVPAEHEPVILTKSNLVIGVCGIDAVGKKIKEICHRSNLVSRFLNTDEEHIINAWDVAKILASTKGQRKDVRCPYKVIINKADTIMELENAKKISKELSDLGINETIITTFKDKL
jgi:probable selenium-dependent hydroxylase accessory protein YqeC